MCEKLTLSDVHENAEMFRGKDFVQLSSFKNLLKKDWKEQQKKFLSVEKFPDIADGIATEQSIFLASLGH